VNTSSTGFTAVWLWFFGYLLLPKATHPGWAFSSIEGLGYLALVGGSYPAAVIVARRIALALLIRYSGLTRSSCATSLCANGGKDIAYWSSTIAFYMAFLGLTLSTPRFGFIQIVELTAALLVINGMVSLLLSDVTFSVLYGRGRRSP
jgi:hypothetical protein